MSMPPEWIDRWRGKPSMRAQNSSQRSQSLRSFVDPPSAWGGGSGSMRATLDGVAASGLAPPAFAVPEVGPSATAGRGGPPGVVAARACRSRDRSPGPGRAPAGAACRAPPCSRSRDLPAASPRSPANRRDRPCRRAGRPPGSPAATRVRLPTSRSSSGPCLGARVLRLSQPPERPQRARARTARAAGATAAPSRRAASARSAGPSRRASCSPSSPQNPRRILAPTAIAHRRAPPPPPGANRPTAAVVQLAHPSVRPRSTASSAAAASAGSPSPGRRKNCANPPSASRSRRTIT